MLTLSILWSLNRWIDQQVRDRQAEIRRLREQQEEDGEGDGDDPPEVYVVEARHKASGPQVPYRCRVCGFCADERVFCPRCLADTLVAAR